MVSKSEPVSIESLLERQRAEKEAAAKPRFLSKEERARIAIEKRSQEIKAQREREEATRSERATLDQQANSLSISDRYRDDRSRQPVNRGDDRRKDAHRDQRRRLEDRPPPPPAIQSSIPTGPRADRNRTQPPPSSSSSMPPPPPPSESTSASANGHTSGLTEDSSAPFVPPMTSDEMDAIRSRYLGAEKKKRKIRKMSDRKFVFDWDTQEDTFADDAPGAVGANRQGAAIGFGRGHIAGLDNGGDGSIRRSAASREAEAANGDHRIADAFERRKATKTGLDERHWTDKPLTEMRDRDWRIFREDFSIACRGGQIPNPIRSWRESDIPEIILDVVDKIGYKEPSPIQRQAIPLGLQKRDVIGVAETGSGKTAAFVIPMLTYITNAPPFTDDNRHLGPYGLILAPTRELAQQIEVETRKFAGPLGYRCVSIVGGRAVEEQAFNLREGAEIIIATPGRLKDVLERQVLVLSQCTYVVMDEADRMVNLGFEADLVFILDKLPQTALEGEAAAVAAAYGDSNAMDIDGNVNMNRTARTRVTTLFSATMPPAVERLARKYLRRAATITIGEAGRAVDTVEQRVEFVHGGEEKKKQRLLEILNSDPGGWVPPIIVFVNQKKTADQVARDLSRAGWSAATLHSGKNQEGREAALASLRNHEVDVLVATDLAGRGIDVQDVSLVVNFQMAGSIEAYVHRIGRTGRAGKQGVAITFLTNDDDEVMYDLKQEISKSPISKVPPELARHEAAQARVTREMKRKRDAEDQG